MSKVYLELFHGRKHPSEELQDWGLQGPVFEVDYAHTTYGCDIKIGGKHETNELTITENLVYYDGVFYGDWSVFNAETFASSDELKSRLQKFDPAKAKLPAGLAESLKPLKDAIERREHRPTSQEIWFRIWETAYTALVTGDSLKMTKVGFESRADISTETATKASRAFAELFEVTPLQRMSEVLNRALELDAEAVVRLTRFYVPCNSQLAVSDVMVTSSHTAEDTGDRVGMLGFLNGMFGTSTHRLAAVYSDDFKQLLRFDVIEWSDPDAEGPSKEKDEDDE